MEALEMDWQLPVFNVKTSSDHRSRSVQAKRALSPEEAYTFIAGDDPRPLLVLRECLTCTGTDDALLTRAADNEKTMLMSRWFHCVKLPPAVIEEDHPFHNLFPSKDPGHLFVAQVDGSNRLDLNGQQSRTELWNVMGQTLVSRYEKKPGHEKTLKSLLKLLDRYDVIDEKMAALREKIDRAIEKDGLKSKKLSKLQAELAKLEKAHAQFLKEAIAVSQLKLREAARAGEPVPQQG
ncbi:MAG: hypothetical protein CMJ89_10055 [Planctomycetes bacterium]|nr:hypothetical protein [Planctomycetota bacterium]